MDCSVFRLHKWIELDSSTDIYEERSTQGSPPNGQAKHDEASSLRKKPLWHPMSLPEQKPLTSQGWAEPKYPGWGVHEDCPIPASILLSQTVHTPALLHVWMGHGANTSVESHRLLTNQPAGRTAIHGCAPLPSLRVPEEQVETIRMVVFVVSTPVPEYVIITLNSPA